MIGVRSQNRTKGQSWSGHETSQWSEPDVSNEAFTGRQSLGLEWSRQGVEKGFGRKQVWCSCGHGTH